MALELIGGAVFTLLSDGVKKALGQNATFRYLLRDLKSTLESLSRVRTTAIQQIGEYNVVLSLPTEEIEGLQKQMEDGIKLVDKLSNFHMWNYCCINCFTDELVDLDRSLRRLLDNLLVQQARDVKEILDLSRKNRRDLDELKGILLNIQQFQQKAGDVMESSASGINKETTPEQNEGNSQEQAASLEGAALGAAFGILFDVVKGAKDKTKMFRSFLRDIKFTLDSLKPLVEEMGVDSLVQYNKVLDRPKEEKEKFRIQLEMGVELVRKCSKVGVWSFYKKLEFTNQLLALDESLRRQLDILREQVARDVRETSVSINNIKMAVEQIEGSGVVQNQLKSKGSFEVPEPHQGAVIEETLISERNIEVGVKGIDEGSSVVQNQFEIEGSCEVPKPAPSPTVELEQLIVKKNQQLKRFLHFKKLKLPRKTRDVKKTMDVEETYLKGLPNDYKDLEREARPRRFSYKELVTATNNFSNKLGEGGCGVVYRGYLTDLDITVAVKKISSVSEQRKNEQCITEVKILGSLRHRNLVQLIGWCHDRGQFLLVYEFMPNGSLNSHLFLNWSALLTWDVRYKISLGLANAMLYLHEELEQYVVHRDIGPSNILLDSSFNVKLGDFGIALLMDHELSHDQTTEVTGTFGYMAPEYMTTGWVCKELDVYSFGVVALEIATGKRVRHPMGEKVLGLVEWVWDLYGKGMLLLAVDERLHLEYDEKQVECLMIVGLCCAHPDPSMRPSVRQAIQILNFEAALPNLQTNMPNLQTNMHDVQSHYQSVNLHYTELSSEILEEGR